jgi:Xaa-Pro aminopeptidase
MKERPPAEARAPFAGRRARALELLGERQALVLAAAPELLAGRDLELRYREDADLFYLTGYTEPEAVAVLSPAHAEAPYTLFVRPRDPEKELWSGRRGGVEAAREQSGADAVLPIGELAERLPAILARADTLLFRLGGGQDGVEALVRSALVAGVKGRQWQGRGPRALVDPAALLADLRLVKDEGEVHLMREAARISVEAFHDAAAAIRPGAGEWEVEAALEAGFRRRGADGFAFQSIVAGGANATILHYVENAAVLRPGTLVLLDGGARYRHYHADISRTFPVSGRFTAEQRVLYDVVHAAQRAAVAAARPGSSVHAVHRAALRVLAEGLVEHGLLEGDPDALLEDGTALKAYYPHRTSHWLGLDVHDVGDYAVDGEPRVLEPGMILTVEPGLYIPRDDEHAPAALRGTGIRIEDDVLVTANGNEVLTAALPAAAAEIEALLRR